MIIDSKDIVCFESGSSSPGDSWTGTVESLGKDVDAIARFVTGGILATERDGDKLRIVGTDRVGLLLLPSGRRIVIRSKIPSLVLLNWLAFLGEFPPLEVWLPEPVIATGDDWHACIGRLFLYELEKVSRQFLRKDYTPVTTTGSTLRGRILTNRLYQSLHRLPQIPQLTRSRTLNTAFNIVLALALDRLPILLKGCTAAEWRLMARLRDLWSRIDREVNDVVSAVTEAQWASPPGYRSALQLARLILIGAAVDPSTGAGGQVFTICLAQIWERSLLKMFTEVSSVTGWLVSPQSDRTRQWDDSIGKVDTNRWMTADLLAESGLSRWVLDAKYKRAFGNESRTDRFQMCAYAVGFNAERATLVYPTAKGQSFDTNILLNATVNSQQIVIDSLELPMVAGPEACKVALIEICGAELPRICTKTYVPIK